MYRLAALLACFAFVELTDSKLLISHDGGSNWDSGCLRLWN
jgi:hypothetical protein